MSAGVATKALRSAIALLQISLDGTEHRGVDDLSEDSHRVGSV